MPKKKPDQADALSPVDRLARAIRDAKAREKASVELSARLAPELAKWAALRDELEELSVSERRRALDDAGLAHVSAAPRPLNPLKGSYIPKRKGAEQDSAALPVDEAPSAAKLSGAKPAKQTATPAPNEKESALRWTPELVEEARARRDKLRAEGVKAYSRQTAQEYGVSNTRLRDLLKESPVISPTKKATVFGMVTSTESNVQRTAKGLIHRSK